MAVKHDTGKAIALLESIADKFPTAKANLGHIYLEGQGCPQDIGKGIGLLGQAADSG
ncbi:SEL1-like repeat protein [Bacteroides uniformis]|nr:SEL1-like repeat protein [Bacteroides uniformis]